MHLTTSWVFDRKFPIVTPEGRRTLTSVRSVMPNPFNATESLTMTDTKKCGLPLGPGPAIVGGTIGHDVAVVSAMQTSPTPTGPSACAGLIPCGDT